MWTCVRRAAGLLLAAAATTAGCGPGKPPAVPVKGKVTFRKATAPGGALVVFHPKHPAFEKRVGGKPFARVKEDGTFTLTTFQPDDGAPEGEYGVTVDWRGGPKKQGKLSIGLGDGGGEGQPLLDPRY